jgi:DNA-binding winged helix-turn-helix (wHTH) protein/tetratricopeptide (TPR) repeat protein
MLPVARFDQLEVILNVNQPRERTFDIGAWRVEPARGCLIAREGGREVRLEPKAMDLLLLFAGDPGAVLSKDRIIAGVWGGRAIGDDTLAAVVSRLRSALGETRDERYIETVSKRGYRLLAEPNVGARPVRVVGVDEAGKLVAKGLAVLKTPLPTALAQARIYFEGAIAADATRADAHAGLAQTLFAQHLSGQGRDLILIAKTAAHAATALDANSAPAWAALGYATLLADRDFKKADIALLKAIALDPSLTSARRYRAFALASVGKFIEVEREARAAIEIDPLSLAARGDLLQMLLVARRYRQTVAEAKRAIDLSATVSEIWSARGWAHFYLGEEKLAVEALLQSLRLWGTDKATLTRLARAHHQGGFETFFARGADLLESQRVMFVPRALDIAMLRTAAGDADAAFAALDKAADRDDPLLLLVPFLPHLDRLRNDARFAALLERVRLVR